MRFETQHFSLALLNETAIPGANLKPIQYVFVCNFSQHTPESACRILFCAMMDAALPRFERLVFIPTLRVLIHEHSPWSVWLLTNDK